MDKLNGGDKAKSDQKPSGNRERVKPFSVLFPENFEGEKEYYQNPNGVCEDAPCCGCCGMF